MDTAIFNLTHGLYVLTTRLGGRDNGCIVDAVMQASAMPQRVAVAVMKKNLSHGMVMGSGLFNLSVLTDETPQKVFRHFGLQSGAAVDKFAGCEEEHRSENGLLYIPKYTNAFLSCRVEQQHDLGTHTLFVAEVTESRILGDDRGITYNEYRKTLAQRQ